jgi:hypothetical protein
VIVNRLVEYGILVALKGVVSRHNREDDPSGVREHIS